MGSEDKRRELTPKQVATAKLIGHDMSWAAAGAEIGVTQKTINEWNKNPEFSELVEREKQEYFAMKVQTVDDRMNMLEQKAMETLKEMLEPGKPDNIKLKAVALILNHQNSRKSDGGGQVLVSFNVGEPGMPAEELTEEGDTVVN